MTTAKYVVRYLFMVFAVAAVCLMVSYDNLIWLAYAAAAAGIISAVLCIASRNKFTVSVFTKERSCEENHPIKVMVRLEKTGFCLLPLVELEVCCGGKCVAAAGSLLFNSSVDIPVSIDVDSCGMTDISVRVAAVHDFVDAVCFKSKISDGFSVAVLPMLRKYPFTIELDKDDGDESPEISKISMTGMPGCEIRQYQDGDSLRSINYKLSAKYGTLLTRVSEKGGGRTVTQLIAAGSGCNAARLALSLAEYLTSQGMTVITDYCGSRFAASGDEIEALRRWLSVQCFGETAGKAVAAAQNDYDFVVNDLAVFNGMPSASGISYAYREQSEEL